MNKTGSCLREQNIKEEIEWEIEMDRKQKEIFKGDGQRISKKVGKYIFKCPNNEFMNHIVNKDKIKKQYLIEAYKIFKDRFNKNVIKYIKEQHEILNWHKVVPKLKDLLKNEIYKELPNEIIKKHNISNKEAFNKFFNRCMEECTNAYIILYLMLKDPRASAEEACFVLSRSYEGDFYILNTIKNNENIRERELNYIALHFAEEYGYKGEIFNQELYERVIELRKRFEEEVNTPMLRRSGVLSFKEIDYLLKEASKWNT